MLDTIIIIGIGIFCFPLLLYLLPYLEASSSEARLMVAYNETRRLSQCNVSDASKDSVETLPDLDPSGQPYRLVLLDTRQVRVMSSGPNGSFSPTGFDADDIYSDMSDPPFDAIVKRKQRRILFAMGVYSVVCASLATAYLWWR